MVALCSVAGVSPLLSLEFSLLDEEEVEFVVAEECLFLVAACTSSSGDRVVPSPAAVGMPDPCCHSGFPCPFEVESESTVPDLVVDGASWPRFDLSLAMAA